MLTAIYLPGSRVPERDLLTVEPFSPLESPLGVSGIIFGELATRPL